MTHGRGSTEGPDTSIDAEDGGDDNGLAALVGVSSTLVTIATHPQSWLREHVYELIAEYIVGGILDAVAYVLGWMIFAMERTASIVGDLADIAISPLETLGDAVVGAIKGLYAAALSTGMPSPVAVAFAITVVGTVLAVVVFATAKVIPGSDAIEGGLEALR